MSYSLRLTNGRLMFLASIMARLCSFCESDEMLRIEAVSGSNTPPMEWRGTPSGLKTSRLSVWDVRFAGSFGSVGAGSARSSSVSVFFRKKNPRYAVGSPMLLLSGESGLSRMVVIVLVIVAVVAVAAGVPMFLYEQKTSLKLSVTTDVRETTNAVETALRKVDQDESKITFAGGYDCVKEGDTRYCTFSKDQPGTVGGVAVSVSKGNTVKVTFYLKLGIYEVAGSNKSLKSGGQSAVWTFYSQTGSSKWVPSEP